MFKQHATFSHFEKPLVELNDSDIIAFTTLRNEVSRLPYFLEYYRKLGVAKFFIVDNGSTDGSSELLKSCDDVIYFYTEESYKGSGAGRDWLYELAHHYGIDRWCLTLDVDELLVYPGVEKIRLPDLCKFMDMEGAQALFCVFLDFYSDKPLSETVYKPGESFLKTCAYYETATYRMIHNVQAPYLSVTGGPRWRMFWNEEASKKGPMMRKVPLVKWDKNFHYIYSTHSHIDAQLSSVTGVLQHFKFFSFFSDLAKEEEKRGDRRQPADYSTYAKALSKDPIFITSYSKKFEHSADLIRDGIMCSTPHYVEFVNELDMLKGDAHAKSMFPAHQDANIVNYQSGELNISAIGRIWPFVNNPIFFKHKLRDKVKTLLPRERVARLSKLIDIEDIHDGKILYSIPEEAWEIIDQQTIIQTTIDDEIVFEQGLLDSKFRRCQRSLTANIYEINCPEIIQNAMQNGQIVAFNIGIVGADDAKMVANIFSGGLYNDDRFSGVCEFIADGSLKGWIYDSDWGAWDTRVVLYINDIFSGRVLRHGKRPDLVKKATVMRSGQLVEINVYGSDFRIAVPENLLETENGRLEIMLKTRYYPYVLRRTPFVTNTLNARWDRLKESWRRGPIS